MFVCTTVLYENMNSLRNDVCNLLVNMHVRIKIYHEFYHCIIYIANEGRHVRIIKFDRMTFSFQTDSFIIEAVDLGRLEALIIGHHGNDPSSAWFLEKVSVKESETDNVRYIFPCGRYEFIFNYVYTLYIDRIMMIIDFYTPAPRRGRGYTVLPLSVLPSSKIFFVAFFSVTVEGRDLIFGHKLHIGTPYRGKRFWTHQIPTSCLPILLIFIHI